MFLLTSCLVSTTLIPRFSHETKIGEMCPPQRVKTNLTPWAYITWKLKNCVENPGQLVNFIGENFFEQTVI